MEYLYHTNSYFSVLLVYQKYLFGFPKISTSTLFLRNFILKKFTFEVILVLFLYFLFHPTRQTGALRPARVVRCSPDLVVLTEIEHSNHLAGTKPLEATCIPWERGLSRTHGFTRYLIYPLSLGGEELFLSKLNFCSLSFFFYISNLLCFFPLAN